MIELFDAARLAPRRDRTVLWMSLAPASAALAIVAAVCWLQRGLDAERAAQAQLSARLAAMRAADVPHPTPALLADLQRQLAGLEVETGHRLDAEAGSPTPSQWLDRLDLLSAAEISLQKIDVDRAGAVRLEGLARDPRAVSVLLQAWDRQQSASSPLPPARAVELRQQEASAELHFVVSASIKGRAS